MPYSTKRDTLELQYYALGMFLSMSFREKINDGMEIKDIEKFYLDYKEIFNNGIYNNLKQGTIDLFGINYFGLKQIDQIISKIQKVKPLDYEIFLKWLKDAKNYNGFYILGI